jgi:cytochrome c oxidase subunit 3
VAEQFDDPIQQREAATLGMWIFIVTEVMLFGGMFTAYTAYRWAYRAGFVEGSRHMELIIGALNTAVLIASSFLMAQAVQNAQRGRRAALLGYLGGTAALGTVFLVLKGVEYYRHAEEGLVPGAHWAFEGPHSGAMQIFVWLYYAMTGLHAIHLTIGVCLVGALVVLTWRGAFTPDRPDLAVPVSALLPGDVSAGDVS